MRLVGLLDVGAVAGDNAATLFVISVAESHGTTKETVFTVEVLQELICAVKEVSRTFANPNGGGDDETASGGVRLRTNLCERVELGTGVSGIATIISHFTRSVDSNEVILASIFGDPTANVDGLEGGLSEVEGAIATAEFADSEEGLGCGGDVGNLRRRELLGVKGPIIGHRGRELLGVKGPSIVHRGRELLGVKGPSIVLMGSGSVVVMICGPGVVTGCGGLI